MKIHPIVILFLIFTLLTSFTSPPKRMKNELEFIKGVFEVNYAPLEWKKDYVDLDLDLVFDKAKEKITPQTTTKQYQQILRTLFNSMCDYHVGVSFYSTESAHLPFMVKGAEGRYFICDIDREELPVTLFPFYEGDEIVAFDNKPIAKVLEQLRVQECGLGNTLETDQAITEKMLTHRLGEKGHCVPSGDAELRIKKYGTDDVFKVFIPWQYSKELVQDSAKLLNSSQQTTATFSEWDHDPIRCMKESSLFDKMMVYPLWKRSFSDFDNKHYIGSRKSYIPLLGKKLWESSKEGHFYAYAFQTGTGKRIGYIRIAHYMGDEQEVEEFCKHIKLLDNRTDALIIDQINNPGGSVFYLYALASALTNKPLTTPKHHMSLTQEEVYMAVTVLPQLEDIKNLKQAKECFGDTLGGYPVTMETVILMKTCLKFIINEWNSGKTHTGLTHLFGVDKIKPHPKARYTKPILLLTNSLDFSGGDFFPAIMQDNNRATIMGERTAGAGGYVQRTMYPNRNGVAEFHFTASIAKRDNSQPIENLGVTPDIIYQLTANDLENKYEDYCEQIVQTVELIIENR